MRILILDDDLNRHSIFKMAFIGSNITSVEKTEFCIQELLENDPFDIVMLDHDLDHRVYVPSGPGTGYEIAEWLRDHPEKMPRLVILHTCNRDGAAKMLEVLPNAKYFPALFMREDLNLSFLENLIV